jgi:hypothetical protein
VCTWAYITDIVQTVEVCFIYAACQVTWDDPLPASLSVLAIEFSHHSKKKIERGYIAYINIGIRKMLKPFAVRVCRDSGQYNWFW